MLARSSASRPSTLLSQRSELVVRFSNRLITDQEGVDAADSIASESLNVSGNLATGLSKGSQKTYRAVCKRAGFGS